jgi:serine/threonine-protein kinase
MSRPSDPRKWAELWAAFDTLVDLDSAARAERLDAIGTADPAARHALEELLEADANPESGLGRIDAIFGAATPERNTDLDVLKLVGLTVAHFRVAEPLAAGGMGVVYRAIDTHLGRPVALKFPLPGQHLDGHVRERFLREARAAAALDHPNICGIYEAGQTENGQLFLAMPLYDGETLKARIARAGPLPIADALAIAEQIARGLHAAHNAGIVHRDLKPANVMILPGGGLKILDFGVARMGDGMLTRSHATPGTVSYMAPEQVRGELVNSGADLWALGVVLYEMLTGRRPFEGDHEIAIAHAILHFSPDRPSALRADVSPALDALVLRLLTKQPVARRTTAGAVVAEAGVLQGLPAAPNVQRGRPRFTSVVRRPLVGLSAVALIVAAAGTTAWLRRAGAASASAEPRIVAVLPFDDLSGGDTSGYLAVALAEEIAARLSRLGAVAVPGDWVALDYRGSRKSTVDIANELGAHAVVRGSVRRANDELRLRVELFDVGERRATWTREYRGPANTVVALQRGATQGIAEALDVDLTRGERAVLRHVPTTNADAYDLYLRGRSAQMGAVSGNVTLPERLSGPQVEALQLAESYYAQARESDPGFAAPRASLAMSHLALARYDRTPARRDQARLEAEAALRLQPAMPEAHEALAAYWSLRADHVQTVVELERALASRPNASHLYRLLGAAFRQLGRWEEAVTALERGARLDPRSKAVHAQAALTYARLRRYDESIAHWDQVIAIDSGDPFPQQIRGFNYLRLGKLDSLEAAIRRIPLGRASGPQPPYAHYTLHHIRRRHREALASLDSASVAIVGDSLVYRPVLLLRAQTLERLGDTMESRVAYDAARRILEEHVAARPRAAGIHIALGLAYAGLDRREDALREARTATELAPVSDNSPLATATMGGVVEIYAQLGEIDEALELIELLLAMPAGREVSVPLLRLDPTFDPLRTDPRFEALLTRFSRN